MSRFGLYLFAREPELVTRAVAAGVDGVIVDWERRGKEERQAGADTEIREDTPADLAAVRATTRAPVLCRVDGPGRGFDAEIERAVELGADEVLLPMVRSPDEVEEALDRVSGRCGLGILVETEAAVGCAESLARLPLTRVYFGLNDFAIERGSASIFEALVDGTVERVRRCFDVPFGVAGLTLPELGSPVPCRLLIGEMARLGCEFSFLRRSFLRDVDRDAMVPAVAEIRAGIELARGRAPEAVERDSAELSAAVGGKLPV
jgi:HpcH/HpaI aldolase/citrate lyase family